MPLNYKDIGAEEMQLLDDVDKQLQQLVKFYFVIVDSFPFSISQADYSVSKRSAGKTPIPMFSFILRKGTAKDKRFPSIYRSDQDDDQDDDKEEMSTIEFTQKMDEDRAQDWNTATLRHI